MIENKRCRFCNAELTDANWCISRHDSNDYICRECSNKRARLWRKANPEKAKEDRIRSSRNSGVLPYYENKECGLFLGVHVAERVLSHVFKDIVKMPMHNPGYDFICNNGYLVDVKSSAIGDGGGYWVWSIQRNVIPDYFLCIAFNNRTRLEPQHIWLIPGKVINHLTLASISKTTLHKWADYELPLGKVSHCCDLIKVKHLK